MASIDPTTRIAIGNATNGTLLSGGRKLHQIPKGAGYRRNIATKTRGLAGPSAPSPSYRHTRPDMGASAIIRCTGWVNVIDPTIKGMPITGGDGSSPTQLMGFSGVGRPTYLYPPFNRGQIYIRGMMGDEAYNVFAVGATGVNSPQVSIYADAGWFDIVTDMSSQDILNINDGVYNNGHGITGSLPNYTDCLIWFLEFHLFR